MPKKSNKSQKIREVVLDKEYFRTCFDAVQNLIIFLDIRGSIYFINRQGIKLLALKEKDIIGKNWIDNFVAPRSKKEVKRIFRQIISKKIAPAEAYENSILTQKGSVVISWKASIIKNSKGNVAGLLCSGIDISGYKRIEEKLKEEKNKFEQLADNSPNMIFINYKGRVVYANKECEKRMGYKIREFYAPDFNFRQLIDPDDLWKIDEAMELHQREEFIEPYEYCLVTKNGGRIDVIINSRLIDYDGGRAILGIITDISELKKAQKNWSIRKPDTAPLLIILTKLYL